jgi:hypothetical protein
MDKKELKTKIISAVKFMRDPDELRLLELDKQQTDDAEDIMTAVCWAAVMYADALDSRPAMRAAEREFARLLKGKGD